MTVAFLQHEKELCDRFVSLNGKYNEMAGGEQSLSERKS
jgi:hypothetical protein